MIAKELEASLHMAFVEARKQRHEFITVEHLLLALQLLNLRLDAGDLLLDSEGLVDRARLGQDDRVGRPGL